MSLPQRALETLGLAYEEQMEVFKLVAVVLKVGNLTFTSVNNIDGTEGCANENEYGEWGLTAVTEPRQHDLGSRLAKIFVLFPYIRTGVYLVLSLTLYEEYVERK